MNSNAAVADRICFSADSLPPRDRFAAVCEEFARRLLTIECINRSGPDFSATFDIRRVGKIAVAYIDSSPGDYVRTPELIRDGQDHLFVTLTYKGTMFCSQPDANQLLLPGQAAVLDSTHIGGIHLDGKVSYVTMRVPRAAIAQTLRPGIDLAGRRLESDSVARRLLFGYVAAARNLDFGAKWAAAEHCEEHILDLVRLALGAEGDARKEANERGARSARRIAILREIDRRSGEHDLSAATLALQLGVTPRYVHLLLEETGKSFTHHLLEKRLEKAAALLRQPRACDRSIAAIALEAGFNDLSYFSRVFRRRYEATPSDVRETAGCDRRGESSEEPEEL